MCHSSMYTIPHIFKWMLLNGIHPPMAFPRLALFVVITLNMEVLAQLLLLCAFDTSLFCSILVCFSWMPPILLSKQLVASPSVFPSFPCIVKKIHYLSYSIVAFITFSHPPNSVVLFSHYRNFNHTYLKYDSWGLRLFKTNLMSFSIAC